MSDDRLAVAANHLVEKDLAGYGFRLGMSSATNRGSEVELVNDFVSIRFATDWLEGELLVTVQPLGGEALPLDAVVDTAGAGLSLSRMKRSTTKGMLLQRLETVSALLTSEAPWLLVGDESPT